MHLSIFESILIVLALAITATIICRYLRMPTVLGYLAIGVFVGPNGMGWIEHLEYTKNLAEFGVVFMMFMVGLEFSLSKLIALKKAVFVLGGLQVVITLGITTFLGNWVGMTMLESVIMGSIVTMSSTAIVIKQLSDQGDLNSQFGYNSIGILLFQDLAVIPFFILITSLSSPHKSSIALTILWSIVKGGITVTIMLIVGRYVLRPFFQMIMGTKIRELFTLTALLVTLFSAWMTFHIGLSLSLGAFIGGVLLGESKFRHNIESEIRPFRDILMGIFFISIGLLLDISSWGDTWYWILLMLAGLVIGKAILIILLNLVFKYDKIVSFKTGITLAQGGEFGFAILTLAAQNRLIPNDYGQVVLGALILSIATAPIIIQYNRKITSFFFRNAKNKDYQQPQLDITKITEKLRKPVVICGFGRIGQNIAQLLQRESFEYIAVDNDLSITQNTQLAGEMVIHGDCSDPDILKMLHLEKARALVISFSDVRAAKKILDQVRLANKKLPILARCRDESESKDLQEHGATRIITETFEESLAIAYHLFREIDVSAEQATDLIRHARSGQYNILRKVFRSEMSSDDESQLENEYLQPLTLPEDAFAVGKAVNALELEPLGAKIVSIRRNNRPPQDVNPKTVLKSGDIVILFGTADSIENAESLLLK